MTILQFSLTLDPGYSSPVSVHGCGSTALRRQLGRKSLFTHHPSTSGERRNANIPEQVFPDWQLRIEYLCVR